MLYREVRHYYPPIGQFTYIHVAVYNVNLLHPRQIYLEPAVEQLKGVNSFMLKPKEGTI
jgi:hypothetical protein